MADEEKIVKEVADMTPEDRVAAWSEWVRAEVNSALDIYLSKALSGHINVRYYPHVIEVQESGPVTDNTKADGVLLSIVFEFENPIDLKKPREASDIQEQ